MNTVWKARLKLTAAALLSVLALTALILALSLSPTRTMIGGWILPRSSRELDLRDLNVRTTWGLARLRDPVSVDLRGSPLSSREMLRLKEKFPACDFRWDVPVGGERFDNLSLSISPSRLSEQEIPAVLSLFPQLQEIDARSCTDLRSLLALDTLARGNAQLRVLRLIPLGTQRFEAETTELLLSAGDARFEDLRDNLALFPSLRSLRITGASLTKEQGRDLQSLYPDVILDYEIQLTEERRFSNRTEELSFVGCRGLSLEFLSALPEDFPELRCLDLTDCGFSNEELCALRDELGIDVRWTIPLFGVNLCTTDTELDISGQYVQDVGELEAVLPCFPHLERVIMCDCGVKDEVMDELDHRYENIRFVWMVHFGAFFLRTDATTFIATTFPYGYSFLTNREVDRLRYCRDLVALDIGHMEYSDVSFLTELTKLRYLILADTRITDISMLSEMKDLYYLELFLTGVNDISPLLECKNLRHLNLAYCTLKNAELLGEMPWLERLWIPGVGLNGAAETAIRSLTGTHVERFCESSTGGTWRTDPAYYEMRDVFGVYYMPG